jgi:hypothetical protein
MPCSWDITLHVGPCRMLLNWSTGSYNFVREPSSQNKGLVGFFHAGGESVLLSDPSRSLGTFHSASGLVTGTSKFWKGLKARETLHPGEPVFLGRATSFNRSFQVSVNRVRLLHVIIITHKKNYSEVVVTCHAVLFLWPFSAVRSNESLASILVPTWLWGPILKASFSDPFLSLHKNVRSLEFPGISLRARR